MARPNCTMEKMFRVIATPEQIYTLENSFYKKRLWGGAATFMMRIMAPVWFEKLQQCNKKYQKVNLRISKPSQTDDFELPRIAFS